MRDEELEALRERKLTELQSKLEGPATPSIPVEIDSAATLTRLVEDHPLVIVDFHAEWCGPCKQQAPILEQLAGEDKVSVAKVDIDQHQQLAQSQQVRSVPTLIVFREGTPTERLVGVQSLDTLRRLIEQHTA